MTSSWKAKMISRREFIQVAAATAAIAPAIRCARSRSSDLTQDQLLRLGRRSATSRSFTHPTCTPSSSLCIFASRRSNLGVGEARGQLPHVSGQALLDAFKIPAGSALAYALSSEDFAALAKDYGRLGGLDRVATVLKHIRAERTGRTLFLDGGDTWQNSYTSLVSKGQDMVDCMALLKPDAMTGHWEFTLGAERVKESRESSAFPSSPERPRHRMERAGVRAMTMIERGGVRSP
jgi:sulfur-oxidizing protein SoxB